LEENEKMAPRKKKGIASQREIPDEKPHASSRIAIILAVIGLIGTLGTALISYLSTKSQIELPISATQTAEAKLAVAITSTANIVQTPIFTDLNKPVNRNGEIIHHLDGGYQTFDAGVSRSNFMAQAEFIVPYNGHPWINVIGFRSVARVWITSTDIGVAESGFGYFDSEGKWKQKTYPLPVGLVNVQEGDKNLIRVIAYDNLGCLYINNESIAELALPSPILADDIKVGISEPEYKIENAVTKYENFSVYSVDVRITSCLLP
jgi:hypothetical protein